MSSDTLPGERDVLSAISALQIMCPNGEMPKEFRAGFWRVMDEAYAEIYRLRAENRSLSFEEQLRRLIEEAVASVETIPEIGNRAAYVLGIVLDEHAVLAYLGPRAMRNKSGRATISKNIPTGRTSLLIAEVRKASKHPSEGDSRE